MRMRSYTLHLPIDARPGESIGLDRAVLVPDGFAWPAFAFGVLWFLFHRLWIAALIVLAGFLALLDVVTPWFVGPLVDDEYAPGTGGILTLVVLGLLTLLALGLHLRRRSRGWLRVVAALRTVSAVTAVPAFVVDGVAPVAVAAAAVCVALTVVCLVLLLSPRLAPR